jgi:hypothetical protein
VLSSSPFFPGFGRDVVHVYLARVIHYPGVARLVDCDTHGGEIGVGEAELDELREHWIRGLFLIYAVASPPLVRPDNPHGIVGAYGNIARLGL